MTQFNEYFLKLPETTFYQDYIIRLKGIKPGIYIIKADMDGKAYRE